MPHLILEYSQSLVNEEQLDALLDQLHQAVCATQLFTESHIKLRAYAACHYRIGGEQRPFIHTQLRIKPGRNSEQKQHLTAAILSTIQSQPWASGVITVEVVDMDADSYAKTHL